MKTTFFMLPVLFSILAIAPLSIFGCACCAEFGHYSIGYPKLGQYEFDELKRLNFGNADLYLTAAGREDVRGLGTESEKFTVESSFDSGVWRLKVKDENGRPGSLTLRIPEKMIDFKADIHDGQNGGAGGPLLYKEWRFKYKIESADGFLKNGITEKTEYFLVLQGRGNVCTAAEDFNHWRLEITGKKANFVFFGKLNLRN